MQIDLTGKTILVTGARYLDAMEIFLARGYGNGSNLPLEPDALAERLLNEANELRSLSYPRGLEERRCAKPLSKRRRAGGRCTGCTDGRLRRARHRTAGRPSRWSLSNL